MADFIELGLEAADHLIDNHFDMVPDEVFHPKEALHNIRHRHQKHPKLDHIEGRPAPSSPTTSSNPTNQHGRVSKQDSRDEGRETGYEYDEEEEDKRVGNGRADASRSGRRRVPRQDPYYLEAENRTRNPRDYDPECLERDRSSPNRSRWAAQQQSPHPLQTFPGGSSSSSLYVSHPADPSYPAPRRAHTSPMAGPFPPYAQRDAPTQAFAPGYDRTIYSSRQRSPPSNPPVSRGAPSQRYDPRRPYPPPNIDPYYTAQRHGSPSPAPAPPAPSTSYAAAAYVPYPYPSAAAAAAAFGAERPWEYESDPSSAQPRPGRTRSMSRSRSRPRSSSRSRSGHRSSHRRRRRRRHHSSRAGTTRRASSTGDRALDPELDERSRPSRHRTRPAAGRRRASSTGDARAYTTSPPRLLDRKRDFGLPSKLSSSDRALGAGGAGALAGGFLAQELGSLLLKSGSKSSSGNNKNDGRSGGGSGSGGGHHLALTLLGAVVGGLGANLMAGKEERRLEGERASVREWVGDVKGEKGLAVRGWNADRDRRKGDGG